MGKCDIIVPIFNGERTIISCLDSINAQNHKYIGKVIIVNDGSIDSTANLVTQFIKSSDLTVDFVNLQTNKGVAHARNIGIEKSQSDWLAFLDADDIWSPDKLDVQFEVIKRKKCAATCSGAHFSRSLLQKLDEIKFYENKKFETANLTRDDFLKSNPVIMSSLIVRRDKIRCEFRAEHHEDYIFCIENSIFNSLTYISSPLIIKRLTPRSLSANLFKSFLATNKIKYIYLKQSIIKIIATLPFYIIQASLRRLTLK